MTERMQRGLTVSKLARLAGVSPNTISTAERGQTMLTTASAERLARALDIETTALIERPGEFRPSDNDSELRQRRHALGLSLREAAQRIGVSRGSLHSAEAGVGVRVDVAAQIAKFYGLDVEKFAVEQGRLAAQARYRGAGVAA